MPSLGDFMHRAKVLKQYRSFVRLARFVDENDGGAVGECRAALEEVRLSYKMGMKKDADALSKNMAFSEVSKDECIWRSHPHSPFSSFAAT